HARRVMPDEEGLAVALGLVHESFGMLDEHSVKGLHVVLGLAPLLPVLQVFHVGKRRKWTLVLDLLPADLSPARHDCRVVSLRCPAMHEVARTGFVYPALRIIKPVRVRHRIEMVQIAEEFVEAMQTRKILVEISQVVLAELRRLVTLRLEHRGESHRMRWNTHVGARLTHGGKTCAD